MKSSAFKNIPNMLTLGNMACGLLGIMEVFESHPQKAFWFMVAAGIFDFLDGFAARLLNVSGNMGKELDSMADMVTFGVLPGLISWNLMESSGYCPAGQFCINRYVWLFFTLAAGWRLAKFNIDTRQSTGFIGAPTPISGLALASVAVSVSGKTMLSGFYTGFYVLKAMPLIMAFLMISEIPMLALKFKKQDPQLPFKIGFLVISLAIFAFFRLDSMPLIYAAYVLSSLIANFAAKPENNG